MSRDPRQDRRRKKRARRRLARWEARRRSIAFGELLADPVLFAKYMTPEHWPTPPWLERFIAAAVAYAPPPPDLDLPRMLKPSFSGASARFALDELKHFAPIPPRPITPILAMREAPPGRVYALPDTPDAPPVMIHDIKITTEPEDTDR